MPQSTVTRKPTASRKRSAATTLWVATRKGLWTLSSDESRRTWKISGPAFLGHIVHHAVMDPRVRLMSK
jgi:hypothetical protein